MDRQAIVSSYEQTRSGRETARVLGVHENTVYQVLRMERGQCRICANERVSDKSYCQKCLDRLAQRAKDKAIQRARDGLCRYCDNPIQPPSRVVCLQHREEHRKASKRHSDSTRKQRGGTPNHRQKRRHLLASYGQVAVDLWERMDGRCEVCTISHSDRGVHIHHINKDRTDNTEANLALLCHRCHRLAHLMTEHPDLDAATAWIARRYQGVTIEVTT